MKIGIIVHSQTSNTYSVAQKLQEKLSTAGHTATIERVIPVGGAHPGVKNLQLESKPEVGAYDALVFAAPVWAFTLSPVMKIYLAQLPSLSGKKIACFVTMGSPFSWMGGNRAIKKVKEICESKGATLCGTAIVNWGGKQREEKITETVEKLSSLF